MARTDTDPPPKGRDVEPLPDFATLSDDALRTLIHELEAEENEVSYRRRLLQGRIDILRAELVARLQKQIEAGERGLADVDRLSDILASKGAPRVEDDPA